MGTKNAVLETIIYSDLFDYPLKKEEVWYFLISSGKTNRQLFEKEFNSNAIDYLNGYFFLKGRQKLVALRIKKESESEEILKRSQIFLKRLSIIPTVMLCGISGSLSMKNSAKDADIDLFVVASTNTVWITRLLLVTLLIFSGKYRKRRDKKVSGKYCLNMIIDENNLSFKLDRQDLFTAHEIVQLLPIFSRDKTYESFIETNNWIKKFLPNVKIRESYLSLEDNFVSGLVKTFLKIKLWENLASFSQKKYMRPVSNEIIKDNFLAFHPNDVRIKTLVNFNKKVSGRKY